MTESKTNGRNWHKKRRGRKKNGNGAGRESEDNLLYKYLPVIENLVLLILNSSRWCRSFVRYLQEELRYRLGLLVRASIYFAILIVFLTGSLVFLLIGAYQFLGQYLGPMLSAFAMSGMALVLALLFFLIILSSFQSFTTSRKSRHEEDLE